jgi:hypothetical protein
MAASNTLWLQRAVKLSMFCLLKKLIAAQFGARLRIQCAYYGQQRLRFFVTSRDRRYNSMKISYFAAT